ncbi:MAG: choice-of-anchor D domain-containing protein, partial [bacterium]
TAKTPQISGNSETAFDSPEINQAVEKFYVIHNNSECTLHVDSLRIVGAAPVVFSVLAPAFPQTINAGDSLAVRLRFGPTTCSLQTATLRIFSNDPARSRFDVSLRGAAVARSDIAVATAPLNFGTICRETTATLSLPISNTGCGVLTIANTTISNPAFRIVTPLPTTIPPGGQASLIIGFSPTATLPYNATLSIFSNDVDENLVTVPLRGSGGMADINGLAEAIFDTVEIQSCAGISNADTVTYLLTNLGVCDLKVDTLLTDTAVFSVIPPRARLIIPPGGSLPIMLRFAPGAEGNYSGVLKIRSNDPNDPELSVTLRGTGVAIPDIDTSTLLVDFGTVRRGSTLRKSIAIRNLGVLPLQVERFVATPSPPFATESREFTLNCNRSDSVEVTFTPVASGLVEGRLEIFSNDPNERSIVVRLLGRGNGPDIAVVPDTLDFGAVCGGEDSLMFVTVRNNGDEILIINSLTISPPAFSTTQTTPFQVPSGGSAQIPVEYSYVERREDTGTLTISTNDPDEPTVIVALHGKGKGPDIELVTPDSVTVCLGSVEPTPICVFNPSDCVLPFDTDSIEIIIISGSGVSSKVVERLIPTFTADSPILIKPKEQFCLNVNVRGLQLGKLTIEVIVKSNIPGKTLIRRSIPVNVVPAEIAGVDRVDFGGVEIFTSSEKPAPVWNASECVVRIDSLKITGTDAAAFAIGTFTLPHAINAGDTAGIPVIFNPTRLGRHTATLLVYNNDRTRNPLSIILIGVGTDTNGACDPKIAVQPTALQFGDVIEKRSLTRFAIVNNAAACELAISALKVVGRDSLVFVADTSGLPLTLARGENDSLFVTFTPPNPGSFMATLLVFNNDTTNNPLAIPLSGVGVECPPAIVVDPTALQFGEVVLGNILAK